VGLILILTEAGGTVGYGHLTRCLAIAKNINIDVNLFVHSDGNEDLCVFVERFSWRDNLYQLSSLIGNRRPSAILVDSYLADQSVLNALRDLTPFLVAIDDYNRINYPCDVIINPAIKGPDLTSQSAVVFSGSAWMILRPEICAISKKESHAPLHKLLLSFGGADKKRMFQRLLPVLLRHGFEITVLVGSQELADELRLLFNSQNLAIFERLEVDDMADLMTSSDLAISAGGQTLNELAFLGVPFLVIETGVDQHWNVKSYVEAGVTPKHFNADDIDLVSALLEEIELLKDASRRREMADRGRQLIDGHGAKRIASILAQGNIGCGEKWTVE